MLNDITDPDETTNILHRETDRLNDRYFPMRKRKICSADDPWVMDEIQRAIRQRKRRFSKHQRGAIWKEAKTITDELIKESKQKYYSESIAKLQESGSNQLPYKILKELAISDRPAAWSINQLDPGKDDQQLAENLADDYFVKITDEFSPLGGQFPTTFFFW